MDIERTLETQRLKLLRMVAGLVVSLGFMALGPVSRGFSNWVARYVGSILSRAELAVRFMLITQACLMVARRGMDIDRRQISAFLDPVLWTGETELSLSECHARLRAVRGVLLDLPRHAMRLLRRIKKRLRRGECSDPISPCPSHGLSISFSGWRLAENRIERPPDKSCRHLWSLNLPPNTGREALVVEA